MKCKKKEEGRGGKREERGVKFRIVPSALFIRGLGMTERIRSAWMLYSPCEGQGDRR